MELRIFHFSCLNYPEYECCRHDPPETPVKVVAVIDIRAACLPKPLYLHSIRSGIRNCWAVYVRVGDRGSTVVKVLCYKSEGRWFDSN